MSVSFIHAESWKPATKIYKPNASVRYNSFEQHKKYKQTLGFLQVQWCEVKYILNIYNKYRSCLGILYAQ